MATIAMVQTVRNLSVHVISKMLGASEHLRHQVTGTWAPTNVTYHLSDSKGGTQHGTDVYAGSGGATAGRDGLDLGGQIHALASRWANLERHESGFPYRYLYRRLVTDSGGPGKYRGGMCHEYALVPHGADGPVHAVLMPGRGTEAPLSIGVFGGYPGCNTATLCFRDGNSADWPKDLGSTTGGHTEHLGMGITELAPGDILYIRHDGAGGYGDPLERDPKYVLDDVIAGLVSHAAARDVYGVVFSSEEVLSVDADGTTEMRVRLRRQRVGNEDLPASCATARGTPPTQNRINEYLQVRGGPDAAMIECRWCGTSICRISEPWKEHVIMRRSSPSVGGPLRSEATTFVLLEFFCPGCGTSLEVESAFGGDAPLHDTIYDWGSIPG
jgi:N-methylhydantoinase B